jgi:DNA repair exonuclease SbcCD ATPase subunit
MLPPRLNEVKERIESKSAGLRSQKERELLEELNALDALLGRTNDRTFSEATKRHTQITSGPGGTCSCCGR